MTEPIPVRDGLDVDDYAITPDQQAWVASSTREELYGRSGDLDYSWNRDGQNDERSRALMDAIDDELSRRHGPDVRQMEAGS